MAGDSDPATHEFCFSLQLMHDARPRNGVKPRLGNRLAAVAADAVGAFVDAPERFFDRLQNLGVRLLELQLDVDFVVAAVAWSAMSPWRVLFSIDA